MRRQQVDLSGIPMSKSLVKQLLFHMMPRYAPYLADLYKDDSEVTTSGEAFRAALVQGLVLLVLCLVYASLVVLLASICDMIGNRAIGDALTRLGAVFLGFPVFMAIMLVMSGCFDLLYFGMTHTRVNDSADASVKYIKILAMVITFVAALSAAVLRVIHIEESIRDHKKLGALKQAQAEHLDYLSRGRHAWNLYITQTPQHGIDLSHTDLSGRDFTGYYFSSVMFDHAVLKGTIFDDCYLAGAWFRESDCRGASFKKAYMSEYTHFDGADLSDADFTGAYAVISALDVAKVKPAKLDNIEPPKKSRWDSVSWECFHTLEWLEKSGYSFSRHRAGSMLKEIPAELND